jgi:hypothetical protein
MKRSAAGPYMVSMPPETDCRIASLRMNSFPHKMRVMKNAVNALRLQVVFEACGGSAYLMVHGAARGHLRGPIDHGIPIFTFAFLHGKVARKSCGAQHLHTAIPQPVHCTPVGLGVLVRSSKYLEEKGQQNKELSKALLPVFRSLHSSFSMLEAHSIRSALVRASALCTKQGHCIIMRESFVREGERRGFVQTRKTKVRKRLTASWKSLCS